MKSRPKKAMKNIVISVIYVVCAAISLNACAKNKHQRLDGHAVQNPPPNALIPMAEENADRPRASGERPVRVDGPPPAITECEPPPDDWDTRGGVTPPVRYEVQGAPAGTDALSRALRARHAEDVPRAEDIARDRDAEQQLRYLASHGDLLLERQRALVLLRAFPSEATRALFVQLSQNENLHVSVRVAALQGLREIAAPDDREAHELLERARRSEEPRIRHAVRGTSYD